MPRIQPIEIKHQNGAAVNGTNGANGYHPHSANPPVSPPPSEEGKLDYHGILSAFRRRWFLAIALGLLFGVPAAIGAWIMAPAPYVSFAELRLRSVNSQAFAGTKESVFGDFNIWKQVVQRRATHPDVLKEALRDSEVNNTGMLREQAPHEMVWLEEHLVVKYEGTEYLRIQLEGEDPHEVFLIVKAVSKALKDDVDNDLNAQGSKRRATLIAQQERVRQLKVTKNTALQNLRSTINVEPALIAREQLYLNQEEQRLLTELRQLNDRKFQFDLEYQLRSEGDESGTSIEDYTNALVDPQVTRHPEYQAADRCAFDLEQSLEDHKKYLEKLHKELDQNHPRIVEANKKIGLLQKDHEEAVKNLKDVQEKVKQELLKLLPLTPELGVDRQEWIKRNLDRFQEQFDKNQLAIQELQKDNQFQQKKLDEYAIQARDLTKDLDDVDKKLDNLESEIEKLDLESANVAELITISREAELPQLRSMKKKTMLTGASGFGLFGFFVAGIVFLEYRTQRIANLNQVSEKLKLRVMGAVPLIPASATKNNTAKRQAKNAIWYSALTEAVDSTRTLLIRGSQMEPLKTLMISSAMGGEGKTTMASHLATSLARGGRKILLVDCDLRRPSVHRGFDLTMSMGLCEVLRGEAQVDDCIQELDSPVGLSILPAGKVNQQVLKLLAMESLDDLLESLKPQYDFIIIDSSPLLPVTDALLVAQHVDGVILSIRRDVSRVSKVVMACQKLSMLGVPLLGAVTIGLQEQGEYQSKYGYSYYPYGQRPTN